MGVRRAMCTCITVAVALVVGERSFGDTELDNNAQYPIKSRSVSDYSPKFVDAVQSMPEQQIANFLRKGVRVRRLGEASKMVGMKVSKHEDDTALIADRKVASLEKTIKKIKRNVAAGNFDEVGMLKTLKQKLADAKNEQARGVSLISTLKGYISSIKTAVAHGDFAESAELPKLSQELADAQAAKQKEESPKASAAVFSGEEDKRTLVLLKLMLQVKKLRDEVADKDIQIFDMQATRRGGKKQGEPVR
jgi:hypothetical protein